MKLLSNFLKITGMNYLGKSEEIAIPKASIEIGVERTIMGSLPQVEFLKAQRITPISNNSQVDTSHCKVTGKGEIYVPQIKDWYTGEGIMNE